MTIKKSNLDTSINGMLMFQSLKADGNMSLNYGDANNALKNKKSFFNKFNIPLNRTLNFSIKNSDEIIHINSEDYFSSDFPSHCKLSTDSIITNLKGLYIYLTFGDCIPFIVYDPENGYIGLGHLGWLSICKNLQQKMISYFVNQIGTDLNKITIILGPSIKSPTYNFSNPAQLTMSEWKEYIVKLENKNYAVDLNGYIINQLVRMGIPKERIIENSIDTGMDDDFFSHYRSVQTKEEEGRFIFGVSLV